MHATTDKRTGAATVASRMVAGLVIALACAISLPAAHGDSDNGAKETLPEAVEQMRDAILDAAGTGRPATLIEAMDLNEITPELAFATPGTAPDHNDPAAVLQAAAPGTGGRAILAGLLNVLALPPHYEGTGSDARYLWPYLAARDLRKLTPGEATDLLRLVPASQARAMRKSGRYTFIRVEIGATGVWHYLGTD